MTFWQRFWPEMQLDRLALWLMGYMAWFATWNVLDPGHAVDVASLVFLMSCFTAGWAVAAVLNVRREMRRDRL